MWQCGDCGGGQGEGWREVAEDIGIKVMEKIFKKKNKNPLEDYSHVFSRDIHLHWCRLRKAERFCLFRVWLCQANKKPEKGKRIYGECTKVIMMMGHETDA